MKRIWIKQINDHVDEKVLLKGWVMAKRDHGGVVFLDFQDRSGQVQLVGNKALSQYNESDVLAVVGTVKKRDPHFVNPKITTGEYEIAVEKVRRLAKSDPLPFNIRGNGYDIKEEVRLRYRYLDLRRPRLRRNLQLRHQVEQLFRQQFSQREFWEIETPYLSKATPEGARDFLVPSRLQPGKFYALPQSPQQYKQLLMIAGVERYFQIVRCFRDEDLRADRQFEFTQIDVEMSFVTREDILAIIEEIVVAVMKALGRKIHQVPFPRISYQEAMRRFGSDKFDLRKNKKSDELAFAWVIDFPLFEKTEDRAISPVHHPFTAPHPEDIHFLDKDPLRVRSWQYDLVCNGHEIAGGSIRITNPQLQAKIFRILGHSQKEIQTKFGHLLDAFRYGVPPHGGIAFGLDRLLAILAGEKRIREVIAFPMTAKGRTAVMDAPSSVSETQLRELGLRLNKKR